MIRLPALFLACTALAACAAGGPRVPQGLYLMAATLDAAEQAALVYQHSAAADPATVARIKDLDASAYAVIGPMAASGSSSAAELAAGQAALAALASYLAQHGVQ